MTIFGGLNVTRRAMLSNHSKFQLGTNLYDKAFNQYESNRKTRSTTEYFKTTLSERYNGKLCLSKTGFNYDGNPYSDTKTLG